MARPDSLGVGTDDAELRKRRDLVLRLQHLVSSINRNARLDLFGSAAVPGLALKQSDIDLGIVGIPVVSAPLSFYLSIYQYIYLSISMLCYAMLCYATLCYLSDLSISIYDCSRMLSIDRYRCILTVLVLCSRKPSACGSDC